VSRGASLRAHVCLVYGTDVYCQKEFSWRHWRQKKYVWLKQTSMCSVFQRSSFAGHGLPTTQDSCVKCRDAYACEPYRCEKYASLRAPTKFLVTRTRLTASYLGSLNPPKEYIMTGVLHPFTHKIPKLFKIGSRQLGDVHLSISDTLITASNALDVPCYVADRERQSCHEQ
jgi:hypothetical protein